MTEYDEFIKYAKEHNLAVMTTEMYEKAISALEQNEKAAEWYKLIVEKFESCEDAISRAEVISLFKTYWRCFVNHDNMELFKGVINDLPSVQPIGKIILNGTPIPDNATNERMVGSWIKSRDSYGNNHFTCSECGNDIAPQYADDWHDNYCNECGADMRGDTE